MKMWITRGRRGVLTLFSQEPVKDRFGRWFGKGESILNFDIPSVTFENSPQQVEISLIKDKESSDEQ